MSHCEAVDPRLVSNQKEGSVALLRPGSWTLYAGAPPLSIRESLADGLVRGPAWWAIPTREREESLEPAHKPVGSSTLSGALRADSPVLVITDADSTLLAEEVIDELAALAHVKDQVAAITEDAMQGEMDFTTSLHMRVALLKGLPESALATVRDRLTVTPGAERLISWTHQVSGKFGVVSGGFEEVLRPLVDRLGVDHLAANRLEIEDGKLTGRVLGDVIDADAKVTCLRSWSDNRPESSAAIGDGANDIPMLTTAGLGVAFCAKPAVREAASSYLDTPLLDGVVGLLGDNLPED